MTDIVERLRNKVWRDVHLYDAAADEIERLRADRGVMECGHPKQCHEHWNDGTIYCLAVNGAKN